MDVLGHEESAKESKNEKATQTSVNLTKHHANQASTEKRRKDVGNERLHGVTCFSLTLLVDQRGDKNKSQGGENK